MKFLCLTCNCPMDLVGDAGDDAEIDPKGHSDCDSGGQGIVARYTCPQCRCRIAMLTNPMEARFVDSLGDQAAPAGEAAPAAESNQPPRPQWTPQGRDRLHKVPRFVRAMVRKIYTDWAAERGIKEITPAVMDAARTDLGLEGM